jgi:NAD(P)-dependent dehydrogenase (short-subunit alcohol dehydrogenase family)
VAEAVEDRVRAPALSGQVAVVVGGSRGIGRAVALALAAEGASVVVNGRGADAAEETRAAIEAAGGRAVAAVGDAARPEHAARAIEHALDAFGRLDALVHCAGIAEPPGRSILAITSEAWHELLDAHLTSVFESCRAAAPHLIAAGNGRIVTTSSHAYQGLYGGTGYPAGKGGVTSLTYALAAELAEHGVRANAVCPGARTRLSTGEGYEAHIRSLHARGLLPDAVRDASLAPQAPELVAPLYVLLASTLSHPVTGRLFSAAGGYVGLHARPGERLVALRDAATQGPWPLEELAERVRESAR